MKAKIINTLEKNYKNVVPRLFYVVEEIEEGVWEQITVGLNSYEEAKQYKERWDGKHPRAFIVSSLNEV